MKHGINIQIYIPSIGVTLQERIATFCIIFFTRIAAVDVVNHRLCLWDDTRYNRAPCDSQPVIGKHRAHGAKQQLLQGRALYFRLPFGATLGSV